MVGNTDFMSSGIDFSIAVCHSATPIGDFMPSSEYLTMVSFFSLTSNNPIVGASDG